VFISNDLTRSAEDIAALYKQRWQIELFFKWIKQNLKVKRFVGRSENAVLIQVLTAMIAYLLLKLIQNSTSWPCSLQKIARLVGINLTSFRWYIINPL
jgi:putative transposase